MLSRTSTTLLAGLDDPRNEPAWRRFLDRYKPMLLSYAKRVGLSDADAQDVVADTLAAFVQAYRAGKYDRQRGRLKSWLGGIIRHSISKRRARRTPASLDAGAEGGSHGSWEPAATGDADEAFDREWQLERLGEALALLRRESDPNTYQAFDLYALKDWPVEKVASFLGMTPNAVYINKTRTLKRLREIVGRLVAEEE